MPIIILEGIDGGGKSTLAKTIKILSPIPATIVHNGPMKGTVEEEYILPLLRAKPDELLIADRWHLSECVYGALYRDKSEVGPVTLLAIEALLTKQKAARFIALPPLKIVRERLATRGEEFLKEADIELVHTYYQTVLESLPYKLARTNTSFDTLLEARNILSSLNLD